MELIKITKWVLPFTFCLFFISVNAKYEKIDFLGMDGLQKVYQIDDKSDSLSSTNLIELIDENEIPIWFGRYFNKVVCDDGLCRMANIWIFWDGVGNFKGFQFNENNPITKSDHVVFSFEDYSKLHTILSNKNSILRNIEQEDLVDSVYLDGVTGATLKQYKDEIVEKAAFTCHTLWHSVYGNTYDEIQHLISERNDLTYLSKLINSEIPAYKIWVINSIIERPEFQLLFTSQIINFIGNEDVNLSDTAVQFINDALMKNDAVQVLLNRYELLDLKTRLQVLTRLSEIKPINDDVILFLLKAIENDNPFLITYIYKTINYDNLKNKKILEYVSRFSTSENRYIKQISDHILTTIEN